MMIRPVSLSSLSGCSRMSSFFILLVVVVVVVIVCRNNHGIDDDVVVVGGGFVDNGDDDTEDHHHHHHLDTAKVVDFSSSSSSSWTATPLPYPLAFSVPFDTNVTDDDNDCDDCDDKTSQPVRGMLYYDWTRRAQRIDHGPGSYECLHFYDTDQPCSLLFRMDGMYRLLLPLLPPSPPPPPPPSTQQQDDSVIVVDCCLDLPNIGTPPPDWASQAPSTYQGAVWDKYAQIVATEWWFDKSVVSSAVAGTTIAKTDHEREYDTTDNNTSTTTTDDAVDDDDTTNRTRTVYSFHTVRQVGIVPPNTPATTTTTTTTKTNNANTTADKEFYWGRPLLFTFPGKALGRQDMHFEYQSMNVGPFDPQTASSLFDLPDGCQQKRCHVLQE